VNDFAQELLADFLEEARPLAENIGEAVLELEREWEGGGSGEQTLHRIKSNLHTLKGNSGMMGLSPIEQLTHRLEDACAIVSERAGSHEATTIELLLAGADALREMLRLAAASGLDEAHGRTLLDPVEKAIDAMRESSATAPARRRASWLAPPPQPLETLRAMSSGSTTTSSTACWNWSAKRSSRIPRWAN